MRHMPPRKERPTSILKVAEFNFSWCLVLMAGLIIFYDIPELRKNPIGQSALILYLTGTIYHTIQAIPSFIRYMQLFLNKKNKANCKSLVKFKEEA
jgi:hypothetical protein